MRPFPTADGQIVAIRTTLYKDFATAYPEAYTDTDRSGSYELGEPYVDRNRNGVWDNATPVGSSTLGGPGDVVSYTVRFPKRVLFGFVGGAMGYGSGVIPLSASTIVRNEAVVSSTS